MPPVAPSPPVFERRLQFLEVLAFCCKLSGDLGFEVSVFVLSLVKDFHCRCVFLFDISLNYLCDRLALDHMVPDCNCN